MYDIISLDSKELSEIREIAKSMNIPKVDKLEKQELIYKILDHQALNPTQDDITKEKKEVKRGRGRPRKVVRPRKEEAKAGIEADNKTKSKPEKEAPREEKKEPAVDKKKEFYKPVEKSHPKPDEELTIVGKVSSDLPSESVKEKELSGSEVGSASQQDDKRNREQPRKHTTERHREEYTFEFEGIITTEGVLEIMADGYGL
nr:Rho termination factor N-terminal domain-containing protein [Deltaproteobacteria bacterium]